MPRYIALLRGINVGGHNVRMARLRDLFEAMGLLGAATHIASGNVVFESSEEDTAALERRIEAHLRDALGYDVPTFIRSCDELAAVATHEPFERSGKSLIIAFLREPPSSDTRDQVLALRTDDDDFDVRGREIYWLTQTGMGKSKVAAPFGKLLGANGTTRNVNTVRTIVTKFCD